MREYTIQARQEKNKVDSFTLLLVTQLETFDKNVFILCVFSSEFSPEDINQFLKSDFEFVASVEDEIRKASHINLTMELFINVRDYVIFRILIANGQRAGAVLSITHDVI